jgi:hypothetical protein
MSTNPGLALLREDFAPNQISYLPKGGAKLAYVGHAALTDRLLNADPAWTWEPLALDARGLPALDDAGGLWIRLTVCGVTRLGYGDAGAKKGGDAMKERIGDALRNAAMRFGAALALWHKGELHAEPEPEPHQPEGMGVQVLDEWLHAISQASPDELLSIARDGSEAAREVRDETAYRAIRSAYKRREDSFKVAA